MDQGKILYGNELDEVVLENDAEELYILSVANEVRTPIFEAVRVTKKDFSVYEMKRKYEKGQLILDVNFQRNKVWGNKQKCELIESILMGLPLPIFYFKQQSNSTYAVVDGKQRLSTLFDFMDNQFPLKSLKILKFLNGKKFIDLTGDLGIYQSQLEDYQVYSHVILPPTPDRILFDIFDRVNRGGTKLNKQEIRNALYHGPGLDMITRITESDAFYKATRIEHGKDTRMKGAYLVTRFWAFYLMFHGFLTRGKEPYTYNGDVDDLIEAALIWLNKAPDEVLSELYDKTIWSLYVTHEILGKGAFRRELNESKPLNMNIFETTMYFMINLYDMENNYSYDRIRDMFEKLIYDEIFLSYIGNARDNAINVFGRFGKMERLLKEV